MREDAKMVGAHLPFSTAGRGCSSQHNPNAAMVSEGLEDIEAVGFVENDHIQIQTAILAVSALV